MIVYLAEKSEFLEDVDSNRIEDRILAEFKRTNRHGVAQAEFFSWRNSIPFMERIVDDPVIPNDAGIAIEFGIPQSNKRIDFIVTGLNSEGRPSAVVVELKQWTEVRLTNKDGIVNTAFKHGRVETAHPSYQAWSYCALLEDFSEAVRVTNTNLNPCAYLHNCSDGSVVLAPFYAEHLRKAPAFLQDDATKLRAFIGKHVKRGDRGKIIYEIRDGKIRPSKNLSDYLVSLLQGNREFLMIDDQKLVYETALNLSEAAAIGTRNVLIVEGGPGTGKSVVAINLLVELTSRGLVAKYVTKNAAPRAVYEQKLTGAFTRSRISNLLTGSGAYHETEPNAFDVLIVDEAHRLTEKSGMFANRGENQIGELIRSAKACIFFLDESQRVTFKDIGRKQEIYRWAKEAKSKVQELALASQFRCNGSDGYIAWIDNTLGIRPTPNETLAGVDYDFRVCSSPNEIRKLIFEKNTIRNKARMVAGYCWDWLSKKNPGEEDIVLEQYNFSGTWNLTKDGSLWIMMPESVTEIGCIHTCQGLEVDYIGVIIGPDLIVRGGEILTDAGKRSKMDSSVKGYKTMLRADPVKARRLADEIIKNTYRTLMTRGQKGCYVWSVDPETNKYLATAASGAIAPPPIPLEHSYATLPLRLLPESELRPYKNAVPVFDLQIAAGNFGVEHWETPNQWVELPEPFTPKEGFFVARVTGESMNRRIPNGSWCLFRAASGGSRQGKVVLVELRDIQDPETKGQYTIKLYESTKRSVDGAWEHETITLRPDSNTPGFSDLIFRSDNIDGLTVRGELVAVLGQKSISMD
jgi:uncharacterized protein